MSLNFWNKTVELGPSRPPYLALVDSVECHIHGVRRQNYAPPWFSAFSTLLGKFDV